jgi:nitrogen fixation protein FixH
MENANTREFTGRKFLAIMVGAFAVIIGVNLLLAFKAVATFPGLETKNSYVASQSFDADRAAQLALGWDVSAAVVAGQIRLSFRKDGAPVSPEIISAVLGRATNVASDQEPVLVFDGNDFTAPVDLATGNWNLRLVAKAADGTTFKQRIIVEMPK